jgi:hypothetical protein
MGWLKVEDDSQSEVPLSIKVAVVMLFIKVLPRPT